MASEPVDPKLTDLCEMIARRQVVVVIGLGVSTATNRQSPTWRGLIETALPHCRTLGAPQDWIAGVEQLLQLPHASMLLSAAELVHGKLSENGGGELARWLRETFEELEPKWCQDWVDDKYYEKSPDADPPGPKKGSNRVIRGGSWNFVARHCRSAYRSWRVPEYRFSNRGFRLVRSSVESSTGGSGGRGGAERSVRIRLAP
jgi:sugar (pentulose or hexulose) kinase